VDNPLREIDFPIANNERKRRLTGDEETRLLAAALMARLYPQALHAAIELAIETGIRQGRFATMDWEQVDLKVGVIWVLTKEKKGAQEMAPVPLSDKAQRILESLSPATTGKVFGDAFPKGETLGGAFRRACKRAQIEDLRRCRSADAPRSTSC
jgi:integrase